MHSLSLLKPYKGKMEKPGNHFEFNTIDALKKITIHCCSSMNPIQRS